MKPDKPCPDVRYCVTCHEDTPHELRVCDGAFVRICARCLERALSKLRVTTPSGLVSRGR